MSVTLNGHTFTTWDDVEKDIFTPEEIAEAELKAAIVAEMVRARKENGITPSRNLKSAAESDSRLLLAWKRAILIRNLIRF